MRIHQGYSECSHSGTQQVLTSRLHQGGLGRGLRGAVAAGLSAIYSESRRDVGLAARHRAPLRKDRLPRALEVHLQSTRSTPRFESTHSSPCESPEYHVIALSTLCECTWYSLTTLSEYTCEYLESPDSARRLARSD